MNESVKKNIRTISGVVISNKMTNSIVVRVERKVKHPVYGKYLRRSTKLHVDDRENKSQIGDVVLIKECRPISKTKNWELVEIIEKAQ
ncbi:MAG TPA: 30S ribosomal protein S17 [Gammaproteobacteria bacterium]|nr:30S ribosomal protein S17 [Gammaproteobacteria bacterium]